MESWDLAILVVAAYVAVTALVRLMTAANQQIAVRLREQFQQEQARRKEEEQRARKKQKTAERKSGAA